MKKYLLILMCAALLLTCGCAGGKTGSPAETDTPTEAPFSVWDAEVIESSHKREEGYDALFSTHAIVSERLTVHMDDKVYDEASLRDIFGELSGMLQTARDQLAAEPEDVTVYVVKSTLTGVPAAVGSSVFCTREDIESGGAYHELFGAAYSLPAQWQRMGLAEYLCGEEADTEGLKEFFMDPENALAASLSPLFMDEELAGEATAGLVKNAAVSAAAYVIETNGFEAFRSSADTSAILGGWLGSIGVSPEIILPEGSESAAEMTVTHERGSICVCSFGCFEIRVLSDSFAKTPCELYELACGFTRGAELLKERFDTETPTLSALIGERLAGGIRLYLTDPETTISSAYTDRADIYLSKTNAAMHELVHVLLAEHAPEEMCWMREALADHYSHEASDMVFSEFDLQSGYEGYLEFFTEISGKEAAEDDLVFHRAVWTLYELLRSPDAEAEGRDDTHAYELAYGISQLLLDNIDRTQIRFKYDRTVGYGYNIPEAPKETAGNQLSYPESLAVFEYLAGIYGAEKLTADQVNDLSLYDSIGLTWQQIYSAAKEYYESEYGELIFPDR